MSVLQDLLLNSLRPTGDGATAAQLSSLTVQEWETVVRTAQQHAVSALLYHRLVTQGWLTLLPTPIAEQLQNDYYTNSARNLYFQHQLALILAHFQTEGIAVILLKGAMLATQVYPDAALRQMVDLDLLLRPADLPRAAAILLALGYQPLAPLADIGTLMAGSHHLPRFVKADAPAIELHWTIKVNPEQDSFAPDGLWQRAQAITIHEHQAFTLCPADLLLHLCCHATYHHRFRQGIRFLSDLTAIIDHYQDGLAWPEVVERASAWACQDGVFLALFLAEALFGAAVPAPVLRQLQRDPQLVVVARDLQLLLFPDHLPLLKATSTSFVELVRTPKLRRKLELIGASLFLPRSVIASTYQIPIDSPTLYGYYLVRWYELLLRYTHKSWLAWRRDPAITMLVTRQAQLDRWLPLPHGNDPRPAPHE